VHQIAVEDVASDDSRPIMDFAPPMIRDRQAEQSRSSAKNSRARCPVRIRGRAHYDFAAASGDPLGGKSLFIPAGRRAPTSREVARINPRTETDSAI